MTLKDTAEHAEVGIERESHPAVRVLAVVWLTGAAVLLGYNLTYWLRIQRKQKHLSPIDSAVILKIAEQCRLLFSIKHPVGIYADPSAQSPYITGIFRPAVYLPKSLISEAVNEQLLKHVIAHEPGPLQTKGYDLEYDRQSGVRCSLDESIRMVHAATDESRPGAWPVMPVS